MNKQNILYTCVGLIAGFALGFFLANNLNRNAILRPSASQNVQNQPFSTAANNPQIQSAADIKESPNGSGGGMMPEVTQTLDQAKNEPNNFVAQIRAGEVYSKIQNAEKASEFYNKAAAIQKDSFPELVTLGNAFFDIKKYEEAEKWYAAALAKNPEDVDVRTDLASTYMARAEPDIERAIKEYRISLEKKPSHESALFNLSIALMRKGDLQGAQTELARLEKVNPQSELLPKLKEKLSQPSNN